MHREVKYILRSMKKGKGLMISFRIRRLWNLIIAKKFPRRIKPMNMPSFIQLEPTNKCNLRCKYCVRESFNKNEGDLSFTNFKKIINKMPTLIRITLQGQGEPFLNKDIFKMIKYASDRGILVNICSNGTILDPEKIKKIISSGLNELAISIDSSEKKRFEELRCGARFDQVVDNIKKLNQAVKDTDLITSIWTTVYDGSIEDMKGIVDLGLSVGVCKILFQLVQLKEDYLKNYDSCPFVKNKRYEAIMERIIEYGRERGMDVLFDKTRCNWPWDQMYITWDGYVTPCCVVLDHDLLKLGNIFEEDVKKIWYGNRYRDMRKLMIDGKIPVCCRGCDRI